MVDKGPEMTRPDANRDTDPSAGCSARSTSATRACLVQASLIGALLLFGLPTTAFLLLGLATTAAADDDQGDQMAVRVDRVAAQGSDLVVDLAIDRLIDSSTESALERGIPVTLVYEIEVWRDRPAWFDRLESARFLSYKLQFDAWDEVYVVRNSDGQDVIFPDLAGARSAIERLASLPIAPLELLANDRTYYLVVEVALKPLTVDDVNELEGWLSGEFKSGRKKGIGILGLPRGLFDLVMSVTGFGDRNDSLRTPEFRREDVIAERANPEVGPEAGPR